MSAKDKCPKCNRSWEKCYRSSSETRHVYICPWNDCKHHETVIIPSKDEQIKQLLTENKNLQVVKDRYYWDLRETIDKLKAKLSARTDLGKVRELLEAVTFRKYGSTYCKSVGGMAWVDARDKALSLLDTDAKSSWIRVEDGMPKQDVAVMIILRGVSGTA